MVDCGLDIPSPQMIDAGLVSACDVAQMQLEKSLGQIKSCARQTKKADRQSELILTLSHSVDLLSESALVVSSLAPIV
jgi:hypothetical protein